jgi:hypothetical protein
MIAPLARLSGGPALVGLLLSIGAAVRAATPAFELPATHQLSAMLIPGHYACVEGTAPTAEFDILDGSAYFLRGRTLLAGEFAYDKATSTIRWTSGPFGDAGKITGYNTKRLADNMPVIILRFENESDVPTMEFCTIVE